jgi:DNA-binding GntR family transcriptional regulator
MTATRETTPRAGRGDSVEAASEAIRDLITGRELLPGQQLRQDELAERLGFSRGPTREALQALRKEGIVRHAKNRGYVVTRFDYFEMQQLYKLRDLVESEVLLSLPKPTAKQVARLRSLNNQLAKSRDMQSTIRLNEAFHFEMFELSPLKLLVEEIDRLWKMATAYRSLGVAVSATPERVMAEAHDGILDAFARHDLDELVKQCREHRDHSLEGIRMLLS